MIKKLTKQSGKVFKLCCVKSGACAMSSAYFNFNWRWEGLDDAKHMVIFFKEMKLTFEHTNQLQYKSILYRGNATQCHASYNKKVHILSNN